MSEVRTRFTINLFIWGHFIVFDILALINKDCRSESVMFIRNPLEQPLPGCCRSISVVLRCAQMKPHSSLGVFLPHVSPHSPPLTPSSSPVMHQYLDCFEAFGDELQPRFLAPLACLCRCHQYYCEKTSRSAVGR